MVLATGTNQYKKLNKDPKNRYSSAKHVRWPYDKDYKDFNKNRADENDQQPS